jgi:hypothetical protein
VSLPLSFFHTVKTVCQYEESVPFLEKPAVLL